MTNTARKQRLMSALINELESKLAVLDRAAQEAHEAATHEESAKEDKHDTRSIELSYLAGAQATRFKELKKLVTLYQQIDLEKENYAQAVAGSFVLVIDEEKEKELECFLLPSGQGDKRDFEGDTLHLITPTSPMGDAIFGAEAGEDFEVEVQGKRRSFVIEKIY